MVAEMMTIVVDIYIQFMNLLMNKFWNFMKNTQNFIGDFSLQYVLTPKGTISLKVYNQSNDRYFTRSSLNTQGIGVVFQKEFGK